MAGRLRQTISTAHGAKSEADVSFSTLRMVATSRSTTRAVVLFETLATGSSSIHLCCKGHLTIAQQSLPPLSRLQGLARTCLLGAGGELHRTSVVALDDACRSIGAGLSSLLQLWTKNSNLCPQSAQYKLRPLKSPKRIQACLKPRCLHLRMLLRL